MKLFICGYKKKIISSSNSQRCFRILTILHNWCEEENDTRLNINEEVES